MKKEDKVLDRFVGKGVFPHQYAFTLLFPIRNIFLSPQKLIDRLELKKNSMVLEIGPGPGYFSTKIAKVVPEGKLVLADIQQEMLDYARNRIEKQRINNVEYYLCDGVKFDFPDNCFDRVFMVTVIGEVANQHAYMKEIHRILKPGGILSVSELAGDPDKMTINEMKALAAVANLKPLKLYGNDRNYTLNFVK